MAGAGAAEHEAGRLEPLLVACHHQHDRRLLTSIVDYVNRDAAVPLPEPQWAHHKGRFDQIAAGAIPALREIHEPGVLIAVADADIGAEHTGVLEARRDSVRRDLGDHVEGWKVHIALAAHRTDQWPDVADVGRYDEVDWDGRASAIPDPSLGELLGFLREAAATEARVAAEDWPEREIQGGVRFDGPLPKGWQDAVRGATAGLGYRYIGSSSRNARDAANPSATVISVRFVVPPGTLPPKHDGDQVDALANPLLQRVLGAVGEAVRRSVERLPSERHDAAGRATTGKAAHVWDLFLAHASPDKAVAEELYDLLTPNCRVFIDSKCIELGDDWDVAITKAQEEALVTVVLVSEKMHKAYYAREEIAAAIDMARDDGDRHRVVPVFLDRRPGKKSSVPYGLRLKHGLVLPDVGPVGVAAKLSEMLARVGGRSTPAAPHKPTRTAPRSPRWYRYSSRGLRWSLATLFVVSVCSISALAYTRAWFVSVDKAEQLYAESEHYLVTLDHSVASRKLRRALRVFRRQGDQSKVAVGLSKLCVSYVAQGKLSRAEPACLEAVTLDSESYGPHSFAVGRDLSGLAALRLAQGRYAEAETTLRKAIKMLETEGYWNSPEVGEPYKDLGIVLFRLEQYRLSYQAHVEALRVRVPGDPRRQRDFDLASEALAEWNRLHPSSARTDEMEAQLKTIKPVVSEWQPVRQPPPTEM